MELTESKGMIKLSFNAKEVNIVTKNNAQLEIFLDGVPLLKNRQVQTLVLETGQMFPVQGCTIS